ncbi:MAG TPA: ABC transporter permease subunit [Geothermobacteraceae bacterium]|nr:ABC transporter permease subunit [Geothermobacteraceae bacterium]
MNPAFLKKIKRNDRLVRWAITIGGMAIICSVILILVLIVNVSLPLFYEPSAELTALVKQDLPGGRSVLAIGMDDYLETGYALDDSGTLRFYDLVSGRETDQQALQPPSGPRELLAVTSYGRLNHVLLWKDGSLSVEQVRFRTDFDENNGNKRSILHEVKHEATFAAPVAGRPLQSLARVTSDGRQTRLDLLADGSLQLLQHGEEENFLGEMTVTEETHRLDLDGVQGRVQALTLSDDGLQLYAGTDRGELLRWDLSDMESPELLEQKLAFDDQRGITALTMVYGDVSLAVGDSAGDVSTWMPVRSDGGGRSLLRIHDLSSHSGPIQTLLQSLRNKNVISMDASAVHLDNMTSERYLLGLSQPDGISLAAMNVRGNGLIGLTGKGELTCWKFEIEHPEVSFKTLFGKVWYEGYDEPAYVWQSSASTDDYEPKLSLVPLIFGTLKGTFYAMLFAVPLAIFGAIYTSQFARPRLRGLVKPAVEVMAAVPTVIIGFLAALWLAPLIERSLGSLFLSLLVVPGSLIVSLLVWQAARRYEPLQRVERGFEFLAIAPVIVLAVALSAVLGSGMENWLFDGNLKQWLFTEWGTRYDPRNCIIIAFAMGFAVIPIIFTIAEDALSNVPSSLKAASLALGASRWQTVWRVMLPSASPGIFAGTMIGFGRAVGETMIVLMATGNTAIMDLSIFNGMRPLSSNIAVEIPEAPVDGSLYRVLFLSAVILFIMTFIVNTVAELIRQRLRSKYGRF